MHNTDVKRKSIPKEVRLRVYDKYDGRCAYCGRKIDYKDMQVDHKIPLYWHNGEESFDNYMPACRMCNFYKSTYTVEKFRERLQTVITRCREHFIFRIAEQYGLIDVKDDKIIFFFEEHDRSGF